VMDKAKILAVVLFLILILPIPSQGASTRRSRRYAIYVVKKGDFLLSIAKRYRIPWKTLARMNGIRPPYKIYRGQRLKVPLPQGRYRLYRVKRGDTLKKIAARYRVSWRTLARVNGIAPPYKIYRGQYLKIPRTGYKPRRKTYTLAKITWKGGFGPPVLSSRAKRGINMGLDYPLSQGEEVLSSAPGKVVYSSLDMRGLGSVLILEHPGGYETVYAGKAIYWRVGEGEVVEKENALGEAVENTVLHFEIRRAGRPLPTSRLVKRRPVIKTKGRK